MEFLRYEIWRIAIDHEVLEWVSLPAKNNVKGVVLITGSVLAAMLSIGLLTHSGGSSIHSAIGWAAFSGILLTFSLRNFFLPIRYTLDADGINVKEFLYNRQRPWDQCKSFYPDRFGVLVSPFAFRTRLENFRGVYLRFAENKEEVLDFCKRKIDGVDEGHAEG